MNTPDNDLAAHRRALLNKMLAEHGLDRGAPDDGPGGAGGPGTPGASGAPGAGGERGGPAPLSSAQQRVWFFQQFEPDTAVYNLTCGIRIRGPLDAGALERSLALVVREHPVLRTVYREEPEGEPVQIVREDLEVPLPVLEPEGPGGAGQGGREQGSAGQDGPGQDDPGQGDHERWVREVARQTARMPFDLGGGAPPRARLLRLGPDHHVLVAVVHHIAADDQTWGVIFPALFRHYTALTAGGAGGPGGSGDAGGAGGAGGESTDSNAAGEGTNSADSAAANTTTYADFAAWEGARLSEGTLARHLAHWREALTPPPPPLPLPVDRVRDPEAGSAGADAALRVPARVRENLLEIGRAHGATPFMTLLAVFTALLHRVTGASDVCVGSPAVLRETPELAELAGNFQNTLALRTDLSGEPTFAELLRRTRQVCTRAYQHQEIPFEKVVADLRPPRTPGRTPFFDTMFLTQEEVSNGSHAPGLDLSEVPLHNGTTQFDLTLAATVNGEHLELTALYRPSLFEPSTVRTLLGHYARLAEAVTSAPDTPVGELPLTTPDEARAAWKAGGSSTGAEPRTLPEALAETVAAHPDRTALTHEGRSLTYAELDERADRLARVLAGGGARPGNRVLLALPRGLDLITAMVAVSRTGAAYVPVDVEHPRARVAAVAADSAPVLAVTDAGHAPDLPEGLETVLVEGPAVHGPDPAEPVRAPRPEDPCYVLYTSGSTGEPKGVVVPHRAVVRLLDSTDRWFGFGEDDVWTMFHSCAFDFSVWEVWGALLRGGRLVVVPARTARSPEAFLDLLERERVTVLNQTPSAFYPLMDADLARGADLALRWVVFGGEVLEPARLRPWFAERPDDRPRLVNMYGITETTVHVTYRPLDARTAETDPGSPIGEAIPDLSLHLLDPGGSPVPDLVVGELHVGGAGVALGYHGRPEQTAERFVAAPEEAGGGTLYRSGDLARRRGDGRLEYLGRADAQFKVRGFRVEPAEIEAALETHADVERSAAVVADDRVAAHLVPAPGAEPDPAALRKHVAAVLPAHMVPAVFHVHDRLPLTANGKLDRDRLAAGSGRRLDASSGAGSAPVAEGLESTVAALWRELLDVPEVGADDNFFDLGGHSLLLAKVRTELSRRLERPVPIAELYAHPTVRSPAAYLERGTAEGPDRDDSARRADRRRAALARTRSRPARGRTRPGKDGAR